MGEGWERWGTEALAQDAGEALGKPKLSLNRRLQEMPGMTTERAGTTTGMGWVME